jgi:phage baseplate assembly protein gpV
VSTFVGVMSEVARRELAAHRALALGVVTEAFSNDGSGDHHLACHVRLHGSELVLQHVPVAVARPGLSALPRVGDLVVLGFLDGDVNGPILLGTIHAAETPSPEAEPDEVVYEVPDPGGDVRRLELKLPNGNTLTVRDDELTIDMGGTKVVVESGGDIRLEAGGAIALEAGGDITLKANGDLKLDAINVDIKAAANATLQASATATLKGALTKIAGMTQFGAG